MHAGGVLLLLLPVLQSDALAQTTGTCAPGQAEAFLEANNVRAGIYNDGALFKWRFPEPGYVVPIGEDIGVMFITTLVFGGYVAGELRTAASQYSDAMEFWPGPLDDDGNPPNDCTIFDRVWAITQEDFDSFNETRGVTPNLRDWPWYVGAPVRDGDGNPDNYNLAGDDLPLLLGDQMLWWIMNDAGNEHPETGTPPIGLEVQGTAFSLKDDGPLDNTTFYHYRFTYKGHAPLEQAYIGFYADVELGGAGDDFIGSDTTLHLGYFYNSDNDDFSYGDTPPALGFTVLRGPRSDDDGIDNDHDGAIDEAGERLGMESLTCHLKNVENYEDPLRDPQQYYNCLQGRWALGQPLTVGGQGITDTGPVTRFLFPGDPVEGEYWSEVNSNGQGTATHRGDRRFYLGSGPFDMQPGDVEEFAFAIVWSRGQDHLDSVRLLKEDVATIRERAEDILRHYPDYNVANETAPPETPFLHAQNFPNPFNATATIRYSLPQPTHVRLRVFDLLGREVATLVDTRQARGVYEVPFSSEGLPAGLYLYRIETDGTHVTRRMLLVR